MICIAVEAALVLAMLTGCTITPVQVRSARPSYDGIHQDSGLIDQGSDGGGFISDQAKARYNALVQTFGKRFTVPLHENEGIDPDPVLIDERRAWRIDPEHLVKFQTMTRWRKEAAP
jgi:hypothetical protein